MTETSLIIDTLTRIDLTAVGSSLARVTCETNQNLLAVARWFFSANSCFCPILRWTRLSLGILYHRLNRHVNAVSDFEL